MRCIHLCHSFRFLFFLEVMHVFVLHVYTPRIIESKNKQFSKRYHYFILILRQVCIYSENHRIKKKNNFQSDIAISLFYSNSAIGAICNLIMLRFNGLYCLSSISHELECINSQIQSIPKRKISFMQIEKKLAYLLSFCKLRESGSWSLLQNGSQ